MDFIVALFQKEQEDMAYRIYVTDALKLLTENGNRTLNIRFTELLEKRNKPQDNRSGEEIVADVIKRCGLVVTEN